MAYGTYFPADPGSAAYGLVMELCLHLEPDWERNNPQEVDSATEALFLEPVHFAAILGRRSSIQYLEAQQQAREHLDTEDSVLVQVLPSFRPTAAQTATLATPVIVGMSWPWSICLIASMNGRWIQNGQTSSPASRSASSFPLLSCLMWQHGGEMHLVMSYPMEYSV